MRNVCNLRDLMQAQCSGMCVRFETIIFRARGIGAGVVLRSQDYQIRSQRPGETFARVLVATTYKQYT